LNTPAGDACTFGQHTHDRSLTAVFPQQAPQQRAQPAANAGRGLRGDHLRWGSSTGDRRGNADGLLITVIRLSRWWRGECSPYTTFGFFDDKNSMRTAP